MYKYFQKPLILTLGILYTIHYGQYVDKLYMGILAQEFERKNVYK